MSDPERASRLWVAIAVATLWGVSVGGEAEDNLPASRFEEVSGIHIARRNASMSSKAPQQAGTQLFSERNPGDTRDGNYRRAIAAKILFPKAVATVSC